MKFYTPTKLSENMYETPEGFLVCVGVPIARTGEMIYGKGETPLETDDTGKVIVTRKENEVFKLETMASFEGKAVTIKHPDDFVSPSNWKDLAKGVLQNVRRGKGEEKNDLIADLLITDAIAIGLVREGLREVSCGYEAEYTQTEKGKGFQTNIIGNHLALVESGRAGISYAIKDHKKGAAPMKLSDKIKAIFAKAQDEAMKAADCGMDEGGEETPAKDTASYDELVKLVKDLGAKVEAFGKKSGDEEKKPVDEKKPGEEKKADDEGGASIEDRLKSLEAAIAKLLEGKSSDEESEEKTDDEEVEVEAEDEESEEAEDEEKPVVTGDTAARAEILAPGIKQTKDVKVAALKSAYKTKEGKKVIDQLTGGKPTYDSAEKVDTLFVAASELLKVKRSNDLSKTKDFRSSLFNDDDKGAMTPEKMNEINEKHFNQKKA